MRLVCSNDSGKQRYPLLFVMPDQDDGEKLCMRKDLKHIEAIPSFLGDGMQLA